MKNEETNEKKEKVKVADGLKNGWKDEKIRLLMIACVLMIAFVIVRIVI